MRTYYTPEHVCNPKRSAQIELILIISATDKATRTNIVFITAAAQE